MSQKKLIPFVAPMAVFIGLLAISGLLEKWLPSAKYWIYPAQTIICGGLVLYFWRAYPMERPRQLWFGIVIGVCVFVLWISPQAFFHFAPRTDGFNPSIFADQPGAYWATVSLRFLRLVLVVPLVEEIFWRAFLLRFLINEDFEKVPLGAFSWLSFAVVVLAFGFSHLAADRPAAFVTGALYNLVMYRTKSLATCVVTHALTNLLLGLWIMKTGQWGFW